jgi:uncharacterized membrane protein
VYDALWATRFSAEQPVAATVVSNVLLAGVVVLLCGLFNGRAAYIHIGAVMGTCMVGNVWRRIIPSQEEAVAATSAGRERDTAKATRARRRAQHNTYLTLPVIFTMIAAHAPTTYSHPLNWLVMLLVIVTGMTARHAMILYDRRVPALTWATAIVPAGIAVVLLAYLTAPRQEPDQQPVTNAPLISFVAVRGLLELRCASCHAEKPAAGGFTAPPGGVRLDSLGEIARNAVKIQATAVSTRAMPPGNVTRMTDEEREIIGRWLAAGASTD